MDLLPGNEKMDFCVELKLRIKVISTSKAKPQNSNFQSVRLIDRNKCLKRIVTPIDIKRNFEQYRKNSFNKLRGNGERNITKTLVNEIK